MLTIHWVVLNMDVSQNEDNNADYSLGCPQLNLYTRG